MAWGKGFRIPKSGGDIAGTEGAPALPGLTLKAPGDKQEVMLCHFDVFSAF